MNKYCNKCVVVNY